MQNLKFKVSIIGTGVVGSSIAYALMLKNIANEIVLIDKNKSLANAEQLDLNCSLNNLCFCDIYSGNYKDIKDSDVIIVTCGRPRKLNETRLDMTYDNLKIAKSVSNEIKSNYTKGIVLVVSNPVDIITYKMIKWLGLSQGKVFGTGCTLDSLRFVNILSDFIGKDNYSKIQAMVIGEHGDSQVPLWSKVKIDNVNIEEFCKNKGIYFDKEIKQKLNASVINMGSNIIKGKGRTNYGITNCAVNIIDSIKTDKKQILSLSCAINDEYNLKDLALSVPCTIGKNGIENVHVYDIDDNEKQMLLKSAEKIKNTLKDIEKEDFNL